MPEMFTAMETLSAGFLRSQSTHLRAMAISNSVIKPVSSANVIYLYGLSSHFPVKHSVRFVSADGHEATPFYFSETIEGDRARTWQVERSEFDVMMLDHARESGVHVRDAGVKEVLFENNKAVGVRLNGSTNGEELRAKVVVDASGRACVIGRQLHLREELQDLRKASAWGYYRGGKRLPGIDAGETTMFMIPGGGWFWYIPLPDDMVSVGIVADPHYLLGDSDDMETAFLREV